MSTLLAAPPKFDLLSCACLIRSKVAVPVCHIETDILSRTGTPIPRFSFQHARAFRAIVALMLSTLLIPLRDLLQCHGVAESSQWRFEYLVGVSFCVGLSSGIRKWEYFQLVYFRVEAFYLELQTFRQVVLVVNELLMLWTALLRRMPCFASRGSATNSSIGVLEDFGPTRSDAPVNDD